MSETKTFVVNRSMWLRGRGARASYLLLDNGQRCCLGFVCAQLGVADEYLLNTPDPGWLMADAAGPIHGVLANVGTSARPNTLTMRAVVINDNKKISDPERERELAALFAEYGYAIEFVDGEP